MQGRLSPMVDNKIQSFPWKNWKKEFEIAFQNNIHVMEWTIDDNNLYKNPLLSDDGTKEILNLKKKYNITIPSLTGDCFMQNPFWKASGDLKKELENDFINILYGCNKVGIVIILIPLVDNGSIQKYQEEKNLFNFLSSKENLLKKLNIKVCFESDFPPKRLKEFINNYNKDFFGINYDTGNSSALGYDPCEEFKEYGERIINVHIKDRPLNGSTVPLGEGDTNFPIVFKMIKKYKYEGNLILQTARAKNKNDIEVLLKYYNITMHYMKESGIIIDQ